MLDYTGIYILRSDGDGELYAVVSNVCDQIDEDADTHGAKVFEWIQTELEHQENCEIRRVHSNECNFPQVYEGLAEMDETLTLTITRS